MGPPYVFYFSLLKNHKFANNSKPAKASEKISTELESLKLKNFYAGLAKFEKNYILPSKICHRFLENTKPFN
jgi:hypothetical protein